MNRLSSYLTKIKYCFEALLFILLDFIFHQLGISARVYTVVRDQDIMFDIQKSGPAGMSSLDYLNLCHMQVAQEQPCSQSL